MHHGFRRIAILGLGLLTLAGLSACRASEEARAQEPLAVTISLESPVEAESPKVEISLRFNGSPTGITQLSLTSGWGGVDDPGLYLGPLTALATDTQEALTVDESGDSAWTVRHAPSQPLEIRCTVPANDHRASTRPRVHYRPVLEPGIFHAIGELTLPRPAHLDTSQPRPVTVTWKGFEEAGWNTVCSLGVGAGPFEETLPMRALRESLFLAGDVRTELRTLHGHTVATAVAGDGWSFDPGDFADLTENILELERTFFHDYEHPFFLVTLLPVGSNEELGRSLGGTSLYNSFATFTTTNTTLESGAELGLDIPRLLLHELFHQWNGRVLRLGEREARAYWFSEGFTAFYTRRFAMAGGWYDADDFVADLNGEVDEYWDNVIRDANADAIEEGFFVAVDVHRIPYLRGSLLAAMLDHEIRLRTVGSRNIDDFMRALVAEANQAPNGTLELNNDRIFERIARWTSADFAGRMRAVAVDGAEMELPEDLFAPALVGQRQPDGRVHFSRTLDSAIILTPRASGR